ncbi:MAG: hypothetical protein LUH21_04425 [Clostridiales bacterium]|nr:hypothetical protein [Clostridiales bacterium]
MGEHCYIIQVKCPYKDIKCVACELFKLYYKALCDATKEDRKKARVILNRFDDPKLSECDYAEVGDYVYARGSGEEFGLTKNKLYQILKTSFDSILVETDNGTDEWFSVEYFSNHSSLN